MNKRIAAIASFFCIAALVQAQYPGKPVPCTSAGGQETATRAAARLHTEKEWLADKKKGTRTLRAYREYTPAGCLSKAWFPSPGNPFGGKYAENIFIYDERGYQVGFQKRFFNPDSVAFAWHDEKHVIDKQGRYAESHYVYNKNRTGMNREVDHDDYFFSYNDPGYSCIVHRVQRIEKDTVETDVYYYDVTKQETPVLTESTYYSGSSCRITVYDAKKRVQSAIALKGPPGSEIESFMEYEYEDDDTKGLFVTRIYHVSAIRVRHDPVRQNIITTDTQRELTEEIIRSGFGDRKTEYRKYEKGKLVKTETVYEPGVDAQAVMEGEDMISDYCPEKDVVEKGRKGISTITTWMDCGNGNPPRAVRFKKVLPNGLLLEAGSAGFDESVQYEYTYYK